MRRFLPLLVAGLLGSCAISPPQPGELESRSIGGVERLHGLDDVLLASQPTPADLEYLAASGVRTVINLRAPSEMDFDESSLARDLGLNYVSLPWRGVEGMTDEVIKSSRCILRIAERPVLVHCGTANRVGALWLIHRRLDSHLAEAEALEEARQVGLRSPELESRALAYIAANQH